MYIASNESWFSSTLLKPEGFENGGFTLYWNVSDIFLASTLLLRDFKNTTLTGPSPVPHRPLTGPSPVSLYLCLGKTRLGNSHTIVAIDFEYSVLKMFSVHTKTGDGFEIPGSAGFEERFPKAPFSWRISVDGRPNCRKKLRFEISPP